MVSQVWDENMLTPPYRQANNQRLSYNYCLLWGWMLEGNSKTSTPYMHGALIHSLGSSRQDMWMPMSQADFLEHTRLHVVCACVYLPRVNDLSRYDSIHFPSLLAFTASPLSL